MDSTDAGPPPTWDDAFHWFRHVALCIAPQLLHSPFTPVNIPASERFPASDEPLLLDWWPMESFAGWRDACLKSAKDGPQIRLGRGTMSGLLATAGHLDEAGSDERALAGIWIAAACFLGRRSLPDHWRGAPYRMANDLGAILPEMPWRLWHHACTAVTPVGTADLADFVPTPKTWKDLVRVAVLTGAL